MQIKGFQLSEDHSPENAIVNKNSQCTSEIACKDISSCGIHDCIWYAISVHICKKISGGHGNTKDYHFYSFS